MERMEKVIDRPWEGVKNALANSPGNWEERTSFLFLFLFFFFFLDRGGSIYGRVMFAGFETVIGHRERIVFLHLHAVITIQR